MGRCSLVSPYSPNRENKPPAGCLLCPVIPALLLKRNRRFQIYLLFITLHVNREPKENMPADAPPPPFQLSPI